MYRKPHRFFRDIQEKNRDIQLNLTKPIGRASKLKWGAAYLRKTRTQDRRQFEYGLENSFRKYEGDIDAYIANVGLAGSRTLSNGSTLWTFHNLLSEIPEDINCYNAEQKILGAYGMIETPVVGRLSFVGGVRYEKTDMQIDVKDGNVFTTDTTATIDDIDWLPSLNLIYKLNPDMNARLSATRTLARPMLREMSASYFDDGTRIYLGNPGLQPTRINNFDLRWEWFLRPGEIIALSGFYKWFDDPIEQVIVGENGDVQPQNVNNGTVYGIEFELRRRLDVIARSLQHFKLGGNFTIVHSEVDLTPEELGAIRAQDPDAEDTRPMAGQSPYVVNVDLGYDNPLSGTAITMLYNVFGKRLSLNEDGATPDIYEQPNHILDLIASQRILGGVKFKFTAKNILDSQVKFSQEFRGNEYVSTAYSKGRSYSIGLSYTFD
jgi:TonB-dependent receptor